ncbi:MAG: NTP transferase domain-containing protein, partial [Oscillospiraceae bacterium]|nr:NTP transferase domain-containing protein [Oscillospiraceae bacterium]
GGGGGIAGAEAGGVNTGAEAGGIVEMGRKPAGAVISAGDSGIAVSGGVGDGGGGGVGGDGGVGGTVAMGVEVDDMPPKVMREACGKPLLWYVLDGLSFINKKDVIIVVGYKREAVISAFDEYIFVEQEEQLGTGHAVLTAETELGGFDGSVLVCCGDMPLIKRDTYMSLVDYHFRQGNDCTLLTGTSSEPLPFGRVVRDGMGGFVEVVEEKDCSSEQLEIAELNSGVYVFRAGLLLDALRSVERDNAQGEYYLTDVPAIMRGGGAKVGLLMRDLGEEIIGVNTPEQLARVEEVLRAR